MDKHVFISYKHDDSDFAENLIQRVKGEGFTTWIDTDGLHPGDDWREGIDQAIRAAFALIVIMSPAAEASSYVTYEWAFAWGCGIKVIPVMYKKTELHPRLGSLQYLDFTNSIRPWDRLMRTLKRAKSNELEASKFTGPKVHDEQKVLEWINKGKEFLKRKEYDMALDAFNQAILRDPNNAYAYAKKCTVLWNLQRYQEALAASQQAIRLDVKLAIAWNNKGIALRRLKRYDEALAAYDETIRLEPDYAHAWNNKGFTLRKLKRYDEAITAYDEAIRLDPDYALAWNNKGYALKGLGKSQEAEQCYKRAKELGYKEDEED
jgi:tetratricopeptide (TPR) repeat protein